MKLPVRLKVGAWVLGTGALAGVAGLPVGCGFTDGIPPIFPFAVDGGGPNNPPLPKSDGGGPPVIIPAAPDGGLLDGGTIFTPNPPATDGGTTDGGAATPPPAPDAGPVQLPPAANGWTFYGLEQGGPVSVYGVTADQAGNIWVAGGEDGLFLLQPGATQLQKFTMADGLHPWGYYADGGEPLGDKYLSVISVAGGPPNTVFVGYMGKPPGPGQEDCENNWDNPNPDPLIYKSGDADRVTLGADGRTLSVVHYDIFSGPGVVKDELQGREKLCNVLRMVWQPSTHSIWFGANHGFAWGRDDFAGDPACDGQLACAGVYEHVHPAINGCSDEACSDIWYFTDAYYGITPDPSGDMWFGGAIRTTRFKYVTDGLDYFQAETDTEAAPNIANRIDVWPDLVEEPAIPRPSQQVPDEVSSLAMDPDGSLWVGSFIRGVAHLDNTGKLLAYLKPEYLTTPRVDSMLRDPLDHSLWIGQDYGGLVRISDSALSLYDQNVLGDPLASVPVFDLQADMYGGTRRLLVAFRGAGGKAGAIGIYTGP